MNIMYRGTKNSVYTAGREIARGGEGIVLEVEGSAGSLLKIYSEPPDAGKQEKLVYMCAMTDAAVHQLAAWPVDVVHDHNGICGFVMKRLDGFVPLHMLFNPMDRKKMFPDKGYNFLVHVARNLATAFYKLHSAGLVLGDVNEGNILVSAKGFIAFIDCDSFQVRQGDKYYFCEVGVPRYTAPELLEQQTFHEVVRTANTDNFSLAVLLFQLLFLGRHPFAGRNNTAEDIDEEKAIRSHQFAYSLKNKRGKLQPPVNSFAISNIGPALTELFHQAFEQRDERPGPEDWVRELGALAGNMTTCAASRVHTYPQQLKECPWCFYKQQKGVAYFLDDSYLNAAASLGDIDQFVNGFKIGQLSLKQLPEDYHDPALTAALIDRKFYRYRLRHRAAQAVAAVIFGILALYNALFIPAGLVAVILLYKYTPWKKMLEAEAAHREKQFTIQKARFIALVKEYNTPHDLHVYSEALKKIEGLIASFSRLPQLLMEKKRLAEEQLYLEQLTVYLSGFSIPDHPIPGFGPAKKSSLYDNGIRTAADINLLAGLKINGIGPKNIQLLYSWQRGIASAFTYTPDQWRVAQAADMALKETTDEKLRLEKEIRKEYQLMLYFRTNIQTRQSGMEAQYVQLRTAVCQADLDLGAFRQLKKTII